MSVKIIQDRLASYGYTTKQEIENASAEVAQEIALSGLARTDFFKHAVFQGGTCLRILYGMQRFSEDLDFLLNRSDRSFNLQSYLKHLETEFRTYGIDVEIQDRSQAAKSVKKAFLKSDSFGKILSVQNFQIDGRLKSLRIKFEVDANPPQGSGFETKYLDFPFPFAVTVQDLQSLFAGKSHALLCREYTKGRDWFDFVWYVGRRVKLNYVFLSNAIDQQGPWQGNHLEVDKNWYMQEMTKKVESVDWKDARQDVIRFLKLEDAQSVELWSREYFNDKLKKLEEYL